MTMEITPGTGPNFAGNPALPLSYLKNGASGSSIQTGRGDSLELQSAPSMRPGGNIHSSHEIELMRGKLKSRKASPPLAELRATLFEDLDKAFEALRKLPPAVSFFGSARIQEGDSCYALAKKIGSMMARYGIPVCTGAGPSIMEFVPNGFLTMGANKPQKNPHMLFYPIIDGFSPEARRDDNRTQGFSVKLPFEEEPNPSVQIKTELKDFTFRKFGLIENKRAYGFFPGGFGTQDELFETWDISSRQPHQNPMALVDKSFWLPQLKALEQVALRDRQLISKDELGMVKKQVTSDPSEFIRLIGSEKNPRGFKEDPEELKERLKGDLTHALASFDKYPEAVTFIGSPRLADDDATCSIARILARDLAKAGVPLRAGDGGSVIKSVAAGALDGNPEGKVDCFLLEADEYHETMDGLNNPSIVQSPVIHKSFIGRKLSALVVLPGDVNTLSELFGVLTMMQTGTIERKPIVLVGRDYWAPLFSAFKKTMLTDDRKLISPKDLNLFTITDNPEEIRDIVLGGKNADPPSE
jgi:predicted Rossmann-fold nucleotide-binding protein